MPSNAARIIIVRGSGLMTTYQFWIQTAVQIAVAIGTLLLAALAIWGAWIRARWLGPKLTLRLFDPEGEKTSINGTPCRWYHLRVTNERRSALARNVRVVLVKVSRPSADGLVRPTSLSGPVQLGWQHDASCLNILLWDHTGTPISGLLLRMESSDSRRSSFPTIWMWY